MTRRSDMKSRGLRLAASIALAVSIVATAVSPAAALYLTDSVIPGKPLTNGGVDWMGTTNRTVVHRVYLVAGQDATFSWSTGSADLNCNLYLYGPSAETFAAGEIDWSTNPGTMNEQIDYYVPSSGWYYLRTEWVSGSGLSTVSCVAEWPVPHAPVTPQRLWGRDRYETAVEIAERNFPSWRNVDHVVICSGEDRAAADPLSAAGLAWTYGAPIFLVKSTGTPDCVIQALQQIRANNGPFYVHIVGGPASVTTEALLDIEHNVTGGIYDRIAPYNDRYTLAASVARRMETERDDNTFMRIGMSYGTALIANGEDPAKFFDALALSPVCAATGWPILLVRKDSIPGPTQQALNDLGLNWRIVAGGPNTVSESVIDQLEPAAPLAADRVWGDDRYETVEAIMRTFADLIVVPPVDAANVGVTAKLPDALTGGSFIGLRRGCILLTQKSSLPSVSRLFLSAHTTGTGNAFVFGGLNSVDMDAYNAIDAALSP